MDLDLKSLASAVNQIAAEREISPEKVMAAIENALGSAYKKEYRSKSEMVKAEFDQKTGATKFWLVKLVVDPEQVVMPENDDEDFSDEASLGKSRDKKSKDLEEVGEDGEEIIRYNPDRHIFPDEAKKISSDAKIGEEIYIPLETQEDFGRIAAQTAKQIILQSVREAERESIHEEFRDKEGEIVSGVVQRYERGHVHVDLGRAMGVMFQNESIPGEHYRAGQRMRFYVVAVQEEERRRPGIVLSRAHPSFVLKLFELEVPEIEEGAVEIKKIAREPGSRTKIAVESHQEGIDPVGSVVGQRGARIMAVINELGNEKIDVVEWSEDQQEFVGNSISPAKAKMVELKERREALILVEDDQLSLAIGKGGQNVRLAAKLTGWKIDVRSQSDPEKVQESGIADLSDDAEVSEEALSKEDELEKSDSSSESVEETSGEPMIDEEVKADEPDPQDDLTKDVEEK